MGWASAFLGEDVEGALNSMSEGFGFGDVSEVASTKGSSPDGTSWWEKGVKQMMPSIMGAAMKPKPQQHAPVAPSGHGVQVNTSGIMKPFDEVQQMANDNPLSGIHQWSNTFS